MHRRLGILLIHKHLLGQVVLEVVHIRGRGIPRGPLERVGGERRLNGSLGVSSHARQAEGCVHAPLPTILPEAVLLALKAVIAAVLPEHLDPLALERVDVEVRHFLRGRSAIIEPALQLRVLGEVDALLVLECAVEEGGDGVIAKGGEAPRGASGVAPAPREAREPLGAIFVFCASLEGRSAARLFGEARAIHRHARSRGPRQARGEV
mmetsp:Transcript_7680/g.18597  ORF Transcript_7680/g.18597 Transcript_7680/m.18597 type:complete len:208 (-) Transcript_7680:495-1118(-)